VTDEESDMRIQRLGSGSIGLLSMLVAIEVGANSGQTLQPATPSVAAATSALDETSEDPAVASIAGRFVVAVKAACENRTAVDACGVVSFTRQSLTDHIAHYRLLVRVGSGPFDVVGLNRIVRERHPGVAVRTSSAMFFVHGAGNGFFDSLVNRSKSGGLALYLAHHDIDVWGMDLRWVQIPREQTEFSFLKAWDFGTHVSDIRTATRAARHMRWLTGQQFDRLILSGHSLGASLAYATANAEATDPPSERDVRGLIPIDTVFQVSPDRPQIRAIFCGVEANYRALLDAGAYTLNSLQPLTAASLAQTDPDSPSALQPTLTNRQFALSLASSPVFGPGAALRHHNWSIWRDSLGRPSDGRYSRTPVILEAMAHLAPWRSRATMIDYFGIPCGTADRPYDDHLAEITVPVLYIGTAGGMGKDGLYVNTLLGSANVTELLIQLLPDDQASDDFAHVDVFTADVARRLVWKPIRHWLARH
jgi:pimeloyl-ACP methyl ester carboxylesterase